MRVTELCHRLLAGIVRAADAVADCTVGNGRDSLFLARLVGGEGRLYGFDVQPAAIAAARALLLEAGIAEERFALFQESHERIADRVPAGLGAAVYNLGYLPGGDRKVVTEGGSTLRSLAAALPLLRPGGAASLTLYRGHRGGGEEAGLLLDFARRLPPGEFAVLHLRYPNMPKDPPELLLIQRQGGRGEAEALSGRPGGGPS